jgi:YVTN family beta-propeller protein
VLRDITNDLFGIWRLSLGQRADTLILTAILLAVVAPSSCTRRPSPPKPYLAFVANRASNTVAVVNLATFQMTASIPVAPEPVQVLAREEPRELWVLSRSGSVSVIAYPALRVNASIDIGSTAANLALTADGRFAAVSGARGEIVLIDGFSHTIEGRVRSGGDISALAFSRKGNLLIAADSAHDRLLFVDTTSRTILGVTQVGKAPGPITILPDESKLFVADTGEPKISVVDPPSRQVLSNIDLASRPVALTLKADGGELIALCRESATLVILDTFHDDVESEMPTGSGPVAALTTRDSKRLFVANRNDGTIQDIDLQNRSQTGSVLSTRAGIAPTALALTPDERFLVVADSGGSSLAVLIAPISMNSAKAPSVPFPLVTTINVGAQPVDVTVPDWLK